MYCDCYDFFIYGEIMAKVLANSLDKTIELPKRYTKEEVTIAIQKWFTKNKLLDESSYVETR